MKINKQMLLFLGIVLIGIGAYSLIPNFEREEFNPDIIEDISSGTITTTTTTVKESDQDTFPELEVIAESNEIFETSVYDSLLINNSSKRIEQILWWNW